MSWHKIFFLIGAGGISALISSCQTHTAAHWDKVYQAAVIDAALIQEEEVADTLLAIDQSNDQLVWAEDETKIKVVTWKARQAYEKFFEPYTATSDNEAYAVWVTLAPQVQQFCSAYMADTSASKEDLDLKLKQYLGLNREWNYDVFVEMWVSPEDLFRPCVDPDTNDTSCDLQFGEQIPVVKNIQDYREFYKDLYYKSFRSSAGVPWTGLGYTYYWGNQDSELGASEFILTPSAAYEIDQVIATMDYCAQDDR